MKELARLHIPRRDDRQAISLGLINSGYGVSIQEVPRDKWSIKMDYYIVVYEKEDK